MVSKKYKDKAAEVAELKEKLSNASSIVVTEYRGLKAGDLVKLRSSLRESQVELRVVKNTLLRRAADGTPLAEVLEKLEGPTAVAIGFGEPAEAAKLLSKSATDLEPFNLTHGIIEKMLVDGKQIEAIGKLPGKQELQAQVAGLMESVVAEFVFAIEAVVREFAGLLEAKAETAGTESA